uniref:Uncharacterized protein n=1 Tax=Plectus sambesii TaxID=2011161 RepID=A0A914VY39_9BILA
MPVSCSSLIYRPTCLLRRISERPPPVRHTAPDVRTARRLRPARYAALDTRPLARRQTPLIYAPTRLLDFVNVFGKYVKSRWMLVTPIQPVVQPHIFGPGPRAPRARCSTAHAVLDTLSRILRPTPCHAFGRQFANFAPDARWSTALISPDVIDWLAAPCLLTSNAFAARCAGLAALDA